MSPRGDTLQALGKYLVLAETAPEEKTDTGIFIPTSAQRTTYVVATIGDKVRIEVDPGDEVVFDTKKAIKQGDFVFVHEDYVMCKG